MTESPQPSSSSQDMPSGGAATPPPGPAPQWQQQPGRQPWQQQPAKRLLRSRDDRWLAGVCAGIGEYAGIDPTLVRLLTVVAAVFSAGTLVIAYIIAWVLMPEA